MSNVRQSNRHIDMRKRSCLTPHRSQRGTSMVEVLVTLIVMGVGMLGVAALYVTTLQAKATSASRMKAVNLAYDMADRIRANPQGAASYVVADVLTATVPSETCKASTNCSSKDMAAADLAQWRDLISTATTGLPGDISASIEQTAEATSTTPQVLTIQLGWGDATATGLSYKLQVQI